jgi:hypothetical protein
MGHFEDPDWPSFPGGEMSAEDKGYVVEAERWDHLSCGGSAKKQGTAGGLPGFRSQT